MYIIVHFTVQGTVIKLKKQVELNMFSTVNKYTTGNI